MSTHPEWFLNLLAMESFEIRDIGGENVLCCTKCGHETNGRLGGPASGGWEPEAYADYLQSKRAQHVCASTYTWKPT